MYSHDRVLGSETGFQTHSQYQCSKLHQKSAFLQTVYLGCGWMWIRPCEQNYGPELRHASLYNVKVIKVSTLAIDHLLYYGRFKVRLVVAKQTVSLTAQLFCPLKHKALREENSDAPKNEPETLAVFNCAYLFMWVRLKVFLCICLSVCLSVCLRMTEITWKGLI